MWLHHGGDVIIDILMRLLVWYRDKRVKSVDLLICPTLVRTYQIGVKGWAGSTETHLRNSTGCFEEKDLLMRTLYSIPTLYSERTSYTLQYSVWWPEAGLNQNNDYLGPMYILYSGALQMSPAIYTLSKCQHNCPKWLWWIGFYFCPTACKNISLVPSLISSQSTNTDNKI